MRRRPARAAAALLCLTVGTSVAACGEPSDPATPTGSAERPVGTASQALECDAPPYAKGAGDYVDGGLERVQDSPTAALEDLLHENSPGTVPEDGFE
jgi:hypothetical protein